jgi:protease-4
MSTQPPPEQPPQGSLPPSQPPPEQPAAGGPYQAPPPGGHPPAGAQFAPAQPPQEQLPPPQPVPGQPVVQDPSRPPPSVPPGGYLPPPGPPPAAPTTRAPQQQPPRKRTGGITCLIVVIVLVVLGLGFFAMVMVALRQGAGPTTTTWTGTTGDAVGVIKITGLISTVSQVSPLFGASAGSENITAQIRKAAADDSVKALIIRINSPGGSAAGSQEIYQAVQEYRDTTGKPVIASMGDIAASGGYYVAAPATKIMASPATLTGSIGVIIETLEYHELMEKIGVSGNPITSGKYKDMGSPLRSMRPDERALFKAMVDDVYDQFVEAVAEGRGMTKEEVKRLADGRAYTGRQAKKVKLVDEVGTFRDAIRLAAKEGGIKGEPTVKFFGRVTLLDALMGDIGSRARQQYYPPGLLFDSRLWLTPDLLLSQRVGPELE